METVKVSLANVCSGGTGKEQQFYSITELWLCSGGKHYSVHQQGPVHFSLSPLSCHNLFFSPVEGRTRGQQPICPC